MERIPCTPEMREDCKYVLGSIGCHSSIHHEFFPRADYKTPIEKQFRELDINKVRLPRCAHDEVHIVTDPPIKPSHDQMSNIVNLAKQGQIAHKPFILPTWQ